MIRNPLESNRINAVHPFKQNPTGQPWAEPGHDGEGIASFT
jgi:hypothetical protein